ncbi:hypothetical protein GEMRC1_010088 [Eukaryota sp. GEM-RC1]
MSTELLIVFATTTGNSEECAITLDTELKSQGFRTNVVNAEDFDASYELTTSSMIVFITATYGEGEFPESAQELWTYLCQASHQEGLLSHLNYAVFGLGSTNFPNFCRAGIDLDSSLGSLGGNRILPVVTVDSSKPGAIQENLDSFAEDLVAELPKFVGPPADVVAQPPKAKYRYVEAIGEMSSIPPPPSGTVRSLVKSIDMLTPADYSRPIFHVKLQTNLRYNIGDALSFQPINDPALVDKFLERLGLNPDDLITILSISGTRSYPPRITWRQFVSEHLGLTAIPTKRLCSEISWFAQGKDQERLKLWGTKDGAADLKSWCDDGNRVFDLFTEFPSLNLSPDMIITILPASKGRLYSVASSPNVHKNEVHLVVVMMSYTTRTGKVIEGSATGTMARVYNQLQEKPSTPCHVAVSFNPGTLKFPRDHSSPVILFGLGVGLAPLLAHLEERDRLIKSGKKLGDCMLFYGCRHESKDYIFRNSIENWVKSGAITDLKVAFSHDQKEFITPLTLLDQDRVTPAKYLKDPNFCYFYCGPAMGIPAKIEKIFVEICEGSGIDPEVVVTNAKKEFRWNVEAF